MPLHPHPLLLALFLLGAAPRGPHPPPPSLSSPPPPPPPPFPLAPSLLPMLQPQGSHPLPAPSPTGVGFSLWKKLRKHIGRSVTNVKLPATVNEPLSGLQKLAEELEHYSLLAAAASEQDPSLRLALVTAFALSPFNSSLRTRIPFTPLLGETFEFVSDDGGGVRFVAEQVSLSPPAAAWWAEGGGQGASWRLWGDLCLRSKFWGKSIEAKLGGEVHLELPGTGDHYVWRKPPCWVHNIILGNIWVEWHGKVTVTNLRTSEAATVRLPKCNRMPGRRGTVLGHSRGSGRLHQVSAPGQPPSSSSQSLQPIPPYSFCVCCCCSLPPLAATFYHHPPAAI